MASSLDKRHLSIVVVGHVDAGKSTTTGHLLHKCGAVDETTLDRLEKEAAAKGKVAFKYAWVLDKLKAERERGITIDIALRKFETDKSVFTITDVPGHRDFTKNAITGISQADAAIVVVSCALGEYEAGMSKNGQTREHLLLAYTLGVKQVVVACNKMDHTTVNYSEDRFKEVSQEVDMYLRKVGYRTGTMVPISGWKGDNLVEPPTEDSMKWYHGPTLVGALENLTVPRTAADKPLRLPLQDVYTIGGIGTVALGKVSTGAIRVGHHITFAPSKKDLKTAKVISLQRHGEFVTEAQAGDGVGVHFENPLMCRLNRGAVCGSDCDDPPKEVESFVAQIIVLAHPGKLRQGYTAVVDCHSAHVTCEFVELQCQIDRRSGRELQQNPPSIKTGDAAIVKLVPLKPLCLEPFAKYPPLGRFAVRDLRTTIAVAIVKSVTTKDEKRTQQRAPMVRGHHNDDDKPAKK